MCGVGLGPACRAVEIGRTLVLQASGDECTLDFYDDQPVGSMRGYVDVGAGRQGFREFLT
jgi:hypothetical protein